MEIVLDHIGKKSQREWVFKDLKAVFKNNEKWVIKGSNGSGKSTLVKVVSGYTSATKGVISYNKKQYSSSFLNFSIAATYLEVIESFTLDELIQFQQNFKPFLVDFKIEKPEQIFNLPNSVKKKYIKDFSSGMRQRVKLGLAILADTPTLILDEPVSNLDQTGILWYHNLIEEYAQNKLVLVCSNSIDAEYDFCNHSLNVEDFKM